MEIHRHVVFSTRLIWQAAEVPQGWNVPIVVWHFPHLFCSSGVCLAHLHPLHTQTLGTKISENVHFFREINFINFFSWNRFFFKNRWIASFSLFLLLQIFFIVKIISKVRNFYNQGEFSLDKKNRTKFYVLWQSVFIYKLRNYKRHSIFLQRHFISYRSSNILYVLRYLLPIFFRKLQPLC